MTAITADEFKKLKPKAQGYVSYMQGAWNPDVPNLCPYPKGSKERAAWEEGEFAGILEAQDCDD